MTELHVERATLGYRERPVLTEISLSLQAGEVLGVVGPNGVGKSTLVKASAGTLVPFKGRVTVGGVDLRRMSPAERARWIAVVPQATRLAEAYRALDVVLMGRTPYLGWFGREGEADLGIALRAMERTGSRDLAERVIGELSGGERQRILIARALAQSPKVLLLDEPTAHLDLRHQDEVLKLVRSLADEAGLAVLLTLHDLNLVARFTDRVALLSNGRIRACGLPSDVLQPTILAQVYGMEIHVMDHPLYGTPMVLA
jgi:iron complex transport system ATP-binding protein